MPPNDPEIKDEGGTADEGPIKDKFPQVRASSLDDPEDESEGDITRFEDVLAALDILENAFDIPSELVQASEPSSDGQYSLFPLSGGQWPYLNTWEEQRRKVLIVELKLSGRRYYLFDTE